MNIIFSSKVSPQSRPALEELMFFNPDQFRVLDGIVSALHMFGPPRFEETAGGISIRVADMEAQTLFAFDRDRHDSDPVGVVVFIRTCPNEIAIMHIAVHADYTMQSDRAGLGLAIVLIEKVKEIAVRIVGVTQILFFYRNDVMIRL
ncbi:MAG: hypothetical protein ACREDS_00705 [Limisphaerales bacterium]